jgi:hypothetical protein
MPANPLFRQAPAPAAEINPYARYGFRWNPFPEKAGVLPGSEDPRLNGTIYVESARAQEQQRFEELLIPHPGRSVLPMAFLMDTAQRKGRGIGKTAFLNHQRLRIMADLGDALSAGAHVLFAVHVFTPPSGNSRKFWQFARTLIESLNEQEVLARLLWRLRAFSGLIPGGVLERAEDPRETIGDDGWLVRAGIDVEKELTPAVAKVLVGAGAEPELAQALAESGHVADKFRHEFLRHQSDHRWRQNAGRWLSADLVSAFRAGGFTRGLFLIDDFEKSVLEQNSRERRTFIDGLRYSFLDGPTPAAATGFYSFLWVLNPYIQELLIGDWNAAGLERFCAVGGERAARYTLDFLPLTPEAAPQLVLGYLDAARLEPAHRGSLHPFDAEAVGEASRLNLGLPGFLLQHLHFAIERGLHENWDTIDTQRIRTLAAALTDASAGPVSESGRLPPPDVDMQAERKP